MLFILALLVALVALILSFQIGRRGLAGNLRALGITAGAIRVIALVALLAAASQTITVIICLICVSNQRTVVDTIQHGVIVIVRITDISNTITIVVLLTRICNQ